MADEKILDKIKKCLALTGSANEHEAAAALRQAQKLMEAHGISDQDVLASQASESNARSGAKSRPSNWETALASRIAAAFGCEVIFCSNRNAGQWRYIGAGATAEIAGYAFQVLFRQACKARRNYIDTALKRVRRPAVKTARADLFCEGWVQTAMATVTAWTVSEEQMAAVGAYVSSHFPALSSLATIDRRPANLRDHHYNDLIHGRSAGRDAELNRGVSGGTNRLALEGGI